MGFERSSSPAVSRGFVLLLVIAVLTIVLTAMVALANTSMRRVRSASDRIDRLQVQWGHRSLRKTLLSRAEPTFALRHQQWDQLRLANRSKRPLSPPPPWIDGSISLGGIRFDIRLGDENAKLPINRIYHQDGPDALTKALRGTAPQWQRAIRLAPAVEPLQQRQPERRLSRAVEEADTDDDPDDVATETEASPPAFRSWGEVLDASILAEGGSDAWPAATQSWSLVESAALNWKRASPSVLIATAESVLGPAGAKRFAQRIEENRSASLAAVLQSEVAVERTRSKLAKRLSGNSEAFTLWVRSRPDVGPGGRTSFPIETRFHSSFSIEEGPAIWYSHAY